MYTIFGTIQIRRRLFFFSLLRLNQRGKKEKNSNLRSLPAMSKNGERKKRELEYILIIKKFEEKALRRLSYV